MSEPRSDVKAVVFPHLDGLRFFCFLSVFFFHAFYTESKAIAQSEPYRFVRHFFRNGDLGVSFFFVLSGFLITYLLLEEKGRFGKIHIAYFYMRRVLRIWPLYFACVGFGFLVFPLLKTLAGVQPQETANPLMYMLFLGNFDVIRNGLPDAGILGVLWSVAVEEQFYLAWPLLLAAVSFGRELWILLAVLAGSVAFRAVETNTFVLTFHTFGMVGDMAIGGLAAYAALNSRRFLAFVTSLSRPAIWAIYVAAAAVFSLDFRDTLGPFDRLGPALVFALIILEQNYAQASLFKMGTHSTLSRLGRWTYGMYCLHMVGNVAAIQVARLLGFAGYLSNVLILVPLTSLCLTIGMAGLSYEFFERPFLRFKRRFQFVVRE
ncbi:MAG: acyltransferase [Vicinamibacteria bacterium]